MSKKEVSINLSESDLNNLNTAIECEDSEGIEDTDRSDTKDPNTKVNKQEIIDNILYTLSIYDISKEDLQTINKLLACL